jgi:hypothetical protein
MSDIDNLITGMDDGDADDSTELQRLKEELDAQRAELDKRSRDLNKGFMEIADRERRLTAEPEEKDDEVPEVPPEAAKILDRYIDKRTKPLEEALQNTYVESVGMELERFAEKAGRTEEELLTVVQEYNLTPKDNSLGAAREVFKKAADIMEAKSRGSEEDLKAKLKAEILEELAKTGVRIEGVAAARELPDDNPDEEELSQSQKYELFKRRAKP